MEPKDRIMEGDPNRIIIQPSYAGPHIHQLRKAEELAKSMAVFCTS